MWVAWMLITGYDIGFISGAFAGFMIGVAVGSIIEARRNYRKYINQSKVIDISQKKVNPEK